MTDAPHSSPELVYLGHVLMENRNGLVVASQVTPADRHPANHLHTAYPRAPARV